MNRVPIAARVRRATLCILGLAAGLAVATPAEAAEERIRIVLHSGEALEGRVYDMHDQYLEIHRSLGSTKIAKSDVQSWTLIADGATGPPGLLLVLAGGHEIGGDVRFVAETLEWVVQTPVGQARYPEKEVVRTIQGSGVTSDGRFTPRPGFRERIRKAIEGLRTGDSLRMAESIDFIEASGFFALRALNESIEKDGRDENIARRILEERFRVVIPAGIEESHPTLLRDLMDGLPESRVQVLREALYEHGSDLYPLLGLLLLDDSQPSGVRSFSVDVLSRMHRIRELLEAYQRSEGQTQFAIAIALGDNGTYIGVPTLIEALELGREGAGTPRTATARQLALARLREYSGENFGFDPEGDTEDQQRAIERWREWWIANKRAIEDSLRQSLVEGEESPRRRRSADLWRQGMLSRDRGKFDSAEQFFLRAHEEDPTSAAPLISLGLLAYTRKSDLQAGIDYFRQALSREAATGEESLRRLCYFHLGRIYQKALDFDMARKSLAKAVEIDPSFSGAWFELGMVIKQQALLIGGEDVERRRAALRDARTTLEGGIKALEAYRTKQTILDLRALPYDDDLPFSTREHNRSLRDIRERLLVEICRFHHQMALISLALGEPRVALGQVESAKQSPEPPAGLEELEKTLRRLVAEDRPGAPTPKTGG